MGGNKPQSRRHALVSLLAAIVLGGCVGQPIVPEHEDTRPAATQAPAASAPKSATPSGARYDLWDRLRAGFALPEFNHPRVSQWEQWYRDRPDYVASMMDRARRYLYYFVSEVEDRGMPLEVALLPAVESAFKANAYSRARAAGLWQFIPSTGRNYGLAQDSWYDERRDVVESTKAALDYLQFLNREFQGDWFYALAAYNAGEGRVGRAIRYNESRGRSVEYHDLRLAEETLGYVPQLVALCNLVRETSSPGIALPAIPNEPYFAEVRATGKLDLTGVAIATGVSEDELRALNAGFRRGAIGFSGPQRLLVPVAYKTSVERQLALMPDSMRVHWTNHRVGPRETLVSIAREYGLSPEEIQSFNRLPSRKVRTGQQLTIPVAESAASSLVAAASVDRRLEAVKNARSAKYSKYAKKKNSGANPAKKQVSGGGQSSATAKSTSAGSKTAKASNKTGSAKTVASTKSNGKPANGKSSSPVVQGSSTAKQPL
jgi:membrane-bound lytic murein transglycosylase D